MRKRVLSWLLVLVLVLGMLPAGVLAAEATDEVSSQSELAGMTDGSYILTADIVLDESWQAINFSGTLNGGGHTITLDGQPLFATLSGTVQNLLLDGSVRSDGNAGALADSMTDGCVENCWSGADVASTSIAGKAAGLIKTMQDGLIQNCLVTGTVTAGSFGDAYGIAGGLQLTGIYQPDVQNCWFVSGTKGTNVSNENFSITKVPDGHYEAALSALNGGLKDGLRAWISGDDGIPKPIGEVFSGDGNQGGGEADDRPASERVADLLPKTEAFVYSEIKNSAQFGQEWMIFGLARAGYNLPDGLIDTYYQSVLEKVGEETADSRPWSYKVTETQRLALALTAIGKDPTDVGGVNLLDYSWNKEKNFPNLGSAALGDRQGANELIFGLLATEAHGSFAEKRPESVTMTSEQMIGKLLDYQKTDGGFGLAQAGNVSGVDMTAMALQALAKHMSGSNVKAAVEKALAYLSKVQTENGAFGTPEAPDGTVESTAQVIVALCELGLDPEGDSFTKNGITPVDDLLSYALEDGSFEHTHSGGSNGMATEQALYALAALERYYAANDSSLYNMNDVVLQAGEGSRETLKQLLKEAADLEDSKSGYTEASWLNFQRYVTAAQKVNEDAEADQTAVDEAAEDLARAFDWLIRHEDFQKLSEQLDAYAALLAHKDEYTAESWAAARAARERAQSVYAKADSIQNSEVTNQNVIDAAAALERALSELTKAEVVFIDSVEELKAIDGTGRYQLTADLTLPDDWSSKIILTGYFDGSGHVLTMQGGGSLFQTVDGEIVHLGVAGTVSGGGAFAETLNGTIQSCYTWASVDNGEKPAGGFAGISGEDVKIANSYGAGMVEGRPAGGLVGRPAKYFNFMDAYWVEGASAGSDGWAGTQMTLAAMKAAEFRETLNQNEKAVTWNRSENGLPWFGRHYAEAVEELAYPVVMTDLITEDTQKITTKEEILTTDVFGNREGYVARLELQGYSGSIWWTTDQDYNYPVTVAAGDGQVRAIGAGSITVTAWTQNPIFEGAEQIQSFRLTVTQPHSFALTLKIDGADYTGKSYTMTGTGATIVPFVTLDGDSERQVAPELFTWSSDRPGVVNVGSRGDLTAKSDGTATITVTLGAVTETLAVSRGYVPVTGIVSQFDSDVNGSYILHSRNPNSVGNGATVAGGADFNPLRNGDSITSQYKIASVTPENATYQGFDVTSDNQDVLRFVAGTLQSLVPRKAGTAALTVTSKDPQLTEQVTDTSQVTLVYLNPLTNLTAEHSTLTVQVGETIDAGLKFEGPRSAEGYHVSESDVVWTQSGDGQVMPYRSYPILMPGDSGYNQKEGPVSNDQWLIKGVEEGKVTLIGTPVDSTYEGAPIVLTITVEKGEQGPEQTVQEQVAAALNSTGSYVYSTVAEDPKFNNEWMVFGLARAGYDLPDHFVEAYYASALAAAKKAGTAESRPWGNKVTEPQRLALALTAVGKDPTNVGGVNLLDYSWNKETYFGSALGSLQGSNELIFGLLSIEANRKFEPPASVSMTAGQMVTALIRDYQTESGGFGLSDNQTAGADITAMALQALAKHKEEIGVSGAIEKGLAYLSGVQSSNGGYGNSESTAQVIVALCELGIDPDADKRFIKNGCSMVDALLDYALDDGSFCHTIGGGSNGMATEQAYYALAALNRFYSGQASLYNMNDVVFDGDGGTEVTGVLLRPATSEIQVGKTVQLTATVLPASAENQNVSFVSSDVTIATVSDTGLVTGLKAGAVTITVTTAEGHKTADAVITVKESGGGGTAPGEKTMVTLSIDKKTINKGYVLQPVKVEITKGETVWEVLKRELDARGIDYEYSYHEQYNSVYIEAIDGDGEFDHGSGSGWMYNVDGVYPDYGCSLYVLNGGETIAWRYTTNLGVDLGRDYSSGGNGTKTDETATIEPEVKPDKNGAANITISKSEMKDVISAAKVSGADSIIIAPQIKGKAVKVAVQLPAQSLKDMVKKTDAALKIQTDVGTLIISKETLDALAQQAGGNTVTIAAEAKDTADLGGQVSAAFLEGAVAVGVTITCDKTEITTLGGACLELAFPVTGTRFIIGKEYKVIVAGTDGSMDTIYGACVGQEGKCSVQIKSSHWGTFVVTAQTAMPFTDVTGHWAMDAIAYVYENGLMNGIGGTAFAPNDPMNRAMLAAILYRMAGEPAGADKDAPFSDVERNTWYTDAVSWTSERGIASGIGNGRFAPMDTITREQLATMLYRYAQVSGLDTSAVGALSKFADGGKVSAWAADGMRWAVGSGLLTGKSANTLDPTGTATRAEVAAILMRFAKLTK